MADEWLEASGDNRREHVRCELIHPLMARLSIRQIGGTAYESRAQRVMVGNVGAGGCRFVTNLELPVREDVEWQLMLELGQHSMRSRAVIVRAEKAEGLHAYGARWTMTGVEMQAFRYRLHDWLFATQIRSPHIRTLYRKLAERRAGEQFRKFDVST